MPLARSATIMKKKSDIVSRSLFSYFNYLQYMLVLHIFFFFSDQTTVPLPGMLQSYSTIFLLRDMAVALSSCIYQSLSDSDAINSHSGKKLASKDFATGAVMEALSRLSVVYQDSSLINTEKSRKMSYDELTEITTEPNKWPGVTSLRYST